MEPRGFFKPLFDIKFIYVLTLIAIGLTALLFIVAAFHQSSGFGALTLLIIAPILSLFYVVYARVFLEFFIAVFRLAETNAELVSLKRIEMGLDVPPPAEPVTDVAR